VKIRLRVVNLLRTWVTKHWVDFDGNPELQSKVEKFVETTVSASNASLASNLIKGMRSKQADEVKKKTVVFSSKAPKPLAPLDKPINAEFGWMDYHATEIARQLTLIEYDMYKSITPFEFLENGWSRKDKEKRAPNILRMTRRFNMVSQWVQSQMCTRTDFRERVHMLQRFIEVAERLRDLNNLNGVSEIVSGLNSSPVHRLKMTWAGAAAALARRVRAARRHHAAERRLQGVSRLPAHVPTAVHRRGHAGDARRRHGAPHRGAGRALQRARAAAPGVAARHRR
jgi:son of sevenless-like protein